MRKKTHAQFVEELKQISPNILILSEYTKADEPVWCRCEDCGHEWPATPNNLLRRRGCKKCYLKKRGINDRLSNEEFEKRIEQKFDGKIKPVDKYITMDTPMKFYCEKHGEYTKKPADVIYSTRGGCPKCIDTRKPQQQFESEVKEIHGNDIIVKGKYISAKKKILCGCGKNSFHKDWSPIANSLLQGRGCPSCSCNGTSWADNALYGVLSSYDTETIYRDRDSIGMELDVYCPNLNIAFEIGSFHWHYEKFDNRWSPLDFQKRQLCEEKGIQLITIYDSVPEGVVLPFAEDCYGYPKDFGQHQPEFFTFMNKILEDMGVKKYE